MDQARSTHDTKDQQDRPDAGHQRWTPLAAELRRLRAEAGDPSFQTIAALVRERRLAAGASPGEARVARSTVYDCFRDGRTRMSLPLVREIALALGVPPDGVDGWIAAARVPPPVVPADGVATDAATDATTEEATDVPVPDAAPRTVPDPEPVHPSSPEHAPAATAGTTGPGPGPRALLVLGCVVLNLMGLAFVSVTAAPFFLDMTGTAIAAIALGPWWGALVGLLSSVVGLGSLAPGELAFTVVNVVGALLWGYGVRSWGLGRTLPRFLALNLGVGIVCTVLSVPILLAVAGAGPRGPEDHLAVTLAASLGTYVAGLVAANLVSSLVDKTVTGFVALVAVSVLPEPWRRGCGLAVADGGRPRHEDEPGGRVTPAGVHPAGGP